MYLLDRNSIAAMIALALLGTTSGTLAMRSSARASNCKTLWKTALPSSHIGKRLIADGSPESVIAHASIARSCQRGWLKAEQAVGSAWAKSSLWGAQYGDRLYEVSREDEHELNSAESQGHLDEQRRYGLDLWAALNPDRVKYLAEHLRSRYDTRESDTEISDEKRK